MALYSHIDGNLFLIDLDQKSEGFRRFISSWLYRSDDITFLVDPGPLSSIGVLKNALDDLEVRKLDYILLTHIHIDHAGGTGKLLTFFPVAQVICHPKGIEHMVNPAKLWEGSQSVLGGLAMVYGEIKAIPHDNIAYQESPPAGNHGIEVLETPGHAPHHLSYLFRRYLFAGEVAGVYQPLPDKCYMRPATPPKFKLETSVSSLDKVIDRSPELICFGHYGFHEDALTLLRRGRDQLKLWVEVLKEFREKGNQDVAEEGMEILMKKDEWFSNFRFLEDDIQKREHYFVMNTLRGMIDYLHDLPTGS